MSALSEAERLELAEQGLADPVFFCRTFLPHWFSTEMPWVHRGILAILTRKTDFLTHYGELDKICENFTYKPDPDDPKSPEVPIFQLEADGSITMVVSRFTLIMMPRGFSKTTLANAANLINILYQLRSFPAYLSETGNHAANQLASVKRELEENEDIRAVFGNLVPGRQDSRKWTDGQIETTTGIRSVARGRGGQVRGTNVGAKRPDLIIMDDVEDEESVQTEEQRAKTHKWAYEAVIPALPPIDRTSSIVALGTLLHREALLESFRKDPEWTTIIFSVVDKDGDPLWPEAMTKEDIEAKRQSFLRVGNLAGFYREYYNQLQSDETAKFLQEYIKIEPWLSDDIVVKALAIDPAISEKKKSDFVSVGVVGMTERGQHIVLEAEGKRSLTPREQVDWYFAMHNKHGLTARDRHGVEAQAYQMALVHLIKEEMFRRGTYFEVEEIRHGQNKLTRVEGILQPRYAAGYISHARHFPLLEQQLLDWPNDKLDVPDVVSMAIALLDPHAAQAAGKDLAEDDYEPLPDVVGGDFRTAP